MLFRSAVSVRALGLSYRGKPVLDGVTFDFPERSFVAVLGPSGCGKTTLLKCMAGLLSPTSGEVRLDGLSPGEVRLKGHVGFAFQTPTLLPWRNSLENVLLPLEILGRHNDPASIEYAKTLLKTVGLESDLRDYPAQLSGGMRQRVSLARALVTRPRFLFLDEPFGALDGLTRDRLNERLRVLWAEYGLTVFCVTHSIDEAVFLADHIAIMNSFPVRRMDIVEIDLEEPRTDSTRGTQKFFDITREIRKRTKGLIP